MLGKVEWDLIVWGETRVFHDSGESEQRLEWARICFDISTYGIIQGDDDYRCHEEIMHDMNKPNT